jgi:hypothetical protein
LSARFGLCRSASTSSARRVRGPGAGVEVGAAALDFFFASLASTLVAWVTRWSASQGRGLGTGVCVAEVWMSERWLWKMLLLSMLGRLSRRRPRGRCVALCYTVFGQFFLLIIHSLLLNKIK